MQKTLSLGAFDGPLPFRRRLALIAATAALGAVAGLAIGCVGIGGIIIVPVMVQWQGLTPQAAIAIAIAGYIFTGGIGTWTHGRQGTLAARPALIVCLASVPAAIAGSLLAHRVSAEVLMLLLAAMTSLSGAYALLGPRGRREGAGRAALAPANCTIFGAVTGFLSALTGTGGPAVLLPMLLYFEVPVVTALGLAQAIQLPIAGFATLVNALRGQVDLALSLTLSLGLVVGGWAGAKLTRLIDPELLRRIMAVALVLGGMAIAAKQISPALHRLLDL